MQPYFYKLRHKPTGRLYVGSQYGKMSDPSGLLTQYFTSSKTVRMLLENDGVDSFEILCVKIRGDARNYEARYLKKAYRFLGSDRFKELFLNRNIAPGIILDEESIKKANSETKRKKCSEAAKTRISNGTHNWIENRPQQTESQRKRTSERMKGNNLGSKRNLTNEYRNTAAEKSKGNTNVRGYRWWTNGIVFKRSKESPGEDFYYGSPPQSEETKRKRALSLKGKPKSEQHKQNLRKKP